MYDVISWYRFIEITDPQAEVGVQKKMMTRWGMLGRVYISHEGVNAQVSAPKESSKAYQNWVVSRFPGVMCKVQEHPEQAFPKLTVKVRRQLVAVDLSLDPTQGGEYVTSKEWREMMEGEEPYLKLDVRNDYEWDLGHFEGFERPPCKTFRDFPKFASELKEKYSTKKPKVMMCCTGGIRCELFSVLMKQEGFDDVYQLEGGIIKYGEEERGKHWGGKLFVFDDRLAVDVNQDEEHLTAHCRFCDMLTAGVYNCANMQCDKLFFSCPDCLENQKGCCQKACLEGGQVRPLDQMDKPFRKWYQYFSEKTPAGC